MKKTPIKKISQKDYVHSAVRFPPALRDEIRAAAEHHGRSFNAEVLARLQASQLDPVMTELERLKAMVQQLIDRD